MSNTRRAVLKHHLPKLLGLLNLDSAFLILELSCQLLWMLLQFGLALTELLGRRAARVLCDADVGLALFKDSRLLGRDVGRDEGLNGEALLLLLWGGCSCCCGGRFETSSKC